MDDNNTQRIREQNDQFRQQITIPKKRNVRGKYFITSGMSNFEPEEQMIIAAMVRDYDDFTEDNDPYGEHDFGSFHYRNQKIFWKIDYYTPDMQHGSEDPANPEKTIRVLTIMLAEEY